jgi:5-formyltetrahydrofolate cyclo-ligase
MKRRLRARCQYRFVTGEIEAQKATHRAAIRAARTDRPMSTQEEESLQAHLARFLRDCSPRRVCGYLAYGQEPSITPLLIELIHDGVTVLLPRRLPDNDLAWVEWDGSEDALESQHRHREPTGEGPVSAITDADVVIVPALCVDHSGNRLGQGGGSYDRAIARVHPHTPIIAVIYASEFVDHVEVDTHDRRVTHVVTPAALKPIETTDRN